MTDPSRDNPDLESILASSETRESFRRRAAESRALSCPNEAELAAFAAARSADENVRAGISRHLLYCDRCAEALARPRRRVLRFPVPFSTPLKLALAASLLVAAGVAFYALRPKGSPETLVARIASTRPSVRGESVLSPGDQIWLEAELPEGGAFVLALTRNPKGDWSRLFPAAGAGAVFAGGSLRIPEDPGRAFTISADDGFGKGTILLVVSPESISLPVPTSESPEQVLASLQRFSNVRVQQLEYEVK